jgi:hypothetical protein
VTSTETSILASQQYILSASFWYIRVLTSYRFDKDKENRVRNPPCTWLWWGDDAQYVRNSYCCAQGKHVHRGADRAKRWAFDGIVVPAQPKEWSRAKR